MTTDRSMLELAGNLLGVDTTAITLHVCRDPWAAYLAEQERLCEVETAERELALATADRLGLQDPEDHDPPRGNLERRCERCTEPWAHGLTMSGGQAVCDPCLRAELEAP